MSDQDPDLKIEEKITDVSPYSSWAVLGTAIVSVIKGALPSDEQKLQAFEARFPNMVARARIRLSNRLFRHIEKAYRKKGPITTDIISTEVKFDNPKLSYIEQADLICILESRFGISR